LKVRFFPIQHSSFPIGLGRIEGRGRGEGARENRRRQETRKRETRKNRVNTEKNVVKRKGISLAGSAIPHWNDSGYFVKALDTGNGKQVPGPERRERASGSEGNNGNGNERGGKEKKKEWSICL
jgi:hypothetical protein